MATEKNWAMAAAEEIATKFAAHRGHASDFAIVDVILKHCPMKQDVAYMEVPRCGTCKHFVPPNRRAAGQCQLLGYVTSGIEPDFGCVKWEKL